MTQKKSFIKPCDPFVFEPFRLPPVSWVVIKNKKKFPTVHNLKKVGAHKQNFNLRKQSSSNFRGK